MSVKIFECDGIIFDLDGVLVDSASVIERHWRNWAQKHGIDPEKSLHATLGLTTAEGIRLVAPHLKAEVEADEIDRAEALDTDGVVAYEGANSLLLSIPEGWWGVATSGTNDTARARLQAAGLVIPDVLTSADDVVRGKPDPEPFLRTAQLMQVQPERCIVIEDSAGGLQGALGAGMTVIAVISTHTPAELEKAHVIVEELKEIQVSVNDPGDSAMRLTVTCSDHSD
jgi:sugar-phosphatase